jgi:hypothetical protein
MFLSLIAICQKPELRNDLEKMALSKRVKCVREISYSKGTPASLEQINQNDSSLSNYLCCFSNDGKLDTLKSFSANGNIEFVVTYKYNKHGLLDGKRKVSAEDALINTTTIFYDQENFKVEEIVRGKRGEVIILTKVKYLLKELNRVKYVTSSYFPESKARTEGTRYDVYSEDNKVSEIIYDADNINYRLTSYEYKAKKLIKRNMERSNGTEVLETRYDYDQHGNVTRTITLPGEEIVTNHYTYNIYNDWVKKITTITHKPFKNPVSTRPIITERAIIYLD